MGARPEIAPTSSSAGFTLIELLVVLAILAFASGVVAVNLPAIRSPAQASAEKFAAQLQAASELALMSTPSLRIESDEQGYRFQRWTAEGWTSEGLPASLRGASVTRGVAAEIQFTELTEANARFLNGATSTDAADVRRASLDPSGMAPRIEAVFSGYGQRWRVVATPGGSIEVSRDG